MKKIFYALLSFTVIILIAACSDDGGTTPNTSGYTYEIPAQLDDGLTTASITDVGISEETMTGMVDHIDETGGHQIHSILVIKNGLLVFEKYFEGFQYDINSYNVQGAYILFSPNTRNYLASVTKSVTSLLFGISKDLGYFQNTDELILDHFPDYEDVLTGDKASISLKHMLTMTCGLQWDENTYPYGDARNDVSALFRGDPTWFILQKDLLTTPGSAWFYNSGNANVLSDIIRRNYGNSVDEFAEEYLFGPLGITNYRWEMLNPDYVFASGGLHLTSRSMAKIGLLCANNGEWNGRQIISSEWIEESIQNYATPVGFGTGFSNGYGYQWWLNTFRVGTTSYNCYFGVGWGEQYIYVFPELDMVVVIPCGYFAVPQVLRPHEIVENYILPAVQN